MRTQTDYNKVVNISEDGEIILLDYIFEDGRFRGAVGSIFQAMSEEDIQDAIGDLEGDDKEVLIYLAENFGNLNREMIESVDSSRKGLIELMFDLSYSELWDSIREQTGLTEDEAVIFNCVGGGRCFDKGFQGNVNPELSELIREIES